MSIIAIIFVFSLGMQVLATSKPYYICNHASGRGLFSCMFTVIGFLDFLEKKQAEGIVLFNNGCYLDPSFGSNWWEYHFKPIFKKSQVSTVPILCNWDDQIWWTLDASKNMPKERAYELYHKYIRPKKHIRNLVDRFSTLFFENKFVVGVHYRGTDKQLTEASKISCDAAILQISMEISKLSHEERNKLVVFVATDEQQFLELAIEKLPNVVYQIGVERSLNEEALFWKMQDPYNEGRWSIIDFLLLSKSNLLIRTSSNLSLMAYLISSDARSILLNYSLHGHRVKAI